MKRNRRQRRAQTGAPMFQIKTTLDFGEEGIPLQRLGDVTNALRQQHQDLVSRVTYGFVPISFDRYVDLHRMSVICQSARVWPRSRRSQTATDKSQVRPSGLFVSRSERYSNNASRSRLPCTTRVISTSEFSTKYNTT